MSVLDVSAEVILNRDDLRRLIRDVVLEVLAEVQTEPTTGIETDQYDHDFAHFPVDNPGPVNPGATFRREES